MEELRCHCGKIVCQIEKDSVIIKCRHCKRFIIIKTDGLDKKNDGTIKVEFK